MNGQNENGGNPAWLKEIDGGEAIEIDFGDRPPVIEGTKVQKITMREPTVGDQIAAQRQAKDDAAAEVLLIANLTEQSPEAIRLLKSRHYNRLRTALAVFMD